MRGIFAPSTHARAFRAGITPETHVFARSCPALYAGARISGQRGGDCPRELHFVVCRTCGLRAAECSGFLDKPFTCGYMRCLPASAFRGPRNARFATRRMQQLQRQRGRGCVPHCAWRQAAGTVYGFGPSLPYRVRLWPISAHGRDPHVPEPYAVERTVHDGVPSVPKLYTVAGCVTASVHGSLPDAPPCCVAHE